MPIRRRNVPAQRAECGDLARLLKSRPAALIVDGEINERALRPAFMCRDELMREPRLHGITDVATVTRAYLKPNGI